MAEFTVNTRRFDPYKNFKFRVKWDGRYVAGISKVSGLKRTTQVVTHREGGDEQGQQDGPSPVAGQRSKGLGRGTVSDGPSGNVAANR